MSQKYRLHCDKDGRTIKLTLHDSEELALKAGRYLRECSEIDGEEPGHYYAVPELGESKYGYAGRGR